MYDSARYEILGKATAVPYKDFRPDVIHCLYKIYQSVSRHEQGDRCLTGAEKMYITEYLFWAEFFPNDEEKFPRTIPVNLNAVLRAETGGPCFGCNNTHQVNKCLIFCFLSHMNQARELNVRLRRDRGRLPPSHPRGRPDTTEEKWEFQVMSKHLVQARELIKLVVHQTFPL